MMEILEIFISESFWTASLRIATPLILVCSGHLFAKNLVFLILGLREFSSLGLCQAGLPCGLALAFGEELLLQHLQVPFLD